MDTLHITVSYSDEEEIRVKRFKEFKDALLKGRSVLADFEPGDMTSYKVLFVQFALGRWAATFLSGTGNKVPTTYQPITTITIEDDLEDYVKNVQSKIILSVILTLAFNEKPYKEISHLFRLRSSLKKFFISL